MKRNDVTRAFSLVELMVVIAIVAILVAVAIPSYKTYTIRAKIASTLGVLENISKVALVEFDKGRLGSTLNVGGSTLTNGTSTAFSAGNVARAVYYSGTAGVPATNLLVCVFVTGLEGMTVSGTQYTAPTTGSQGWKNAYCTYTIPVNGINTMYCGNWDFSSDTYIPVNYLPAGCNCAKLSTQEC